MRQTLTPRQQAVLDHVLASEAPELDRELGSSFWRAQYRFLGAALRQLVIERCDQAQLDHAIEHGAELTEAQIFEHISANVRLRWLDAVQGRAFADLLIVVGRCRSLAERAATKHDGPMVTLPRGDALLLLDAAVFAAERLDREASDDDKRRHSEQLGPVRAALAVYDDPVPLDITAVAALAYVARVALLRARGRGR